MVLVLSFSSVLVNRSYSQAQMKKIRLKPFWHKFNINVCALADHLGPKPYLQQATLFAFQPNASTTLVD